MLHPGRAVVVDVLLDLRLPLPRRGLVDGHLDGLLPVGHDHGPERGVLRVHLAVVHGPEAVEQEVLLVPGKKRDTVLRLYSVCTSRHNC